MKSKILLATTLCCVTLFSAGCYQQDRQLLRPKVESSSVENGIEAENYNTNITVGNKKLLVEVVNKDTARELGLSNRANLLDENGMLFDFTNTNLTQPSFWMKDMNFNLDMIWIKDGKIVAITENVLAPIDNTKNNTSNLKTYSPPSGITHVLEVNSGWSKKNNIKIGDSIKFN